MPRVRLSREWGYAGSEAIPGVRLSREWGYPGSEAIPRVRLPWDRHCLNWAHHGEELTVAPASSAATPSTYQHPLSAFCPLHQENAHWLTSTQQLHVCHNFAITTTTANFMKGHAWCCDHDYEPNADTCRYINHYTAVSSATLPHCTIAYCSYTLLFNTIQTNIHIW